MKSFNFWLTQGKGKNYDCWILPVDVARYRKASVQMSLQDSKWAAKSHTLGQSADRKSWLGMPLCEYRLEGGGKRTCSSRSSRALQMGV